MNFKAVGMLSTLIKHIYKQVTTNWKWAYHLSLKPVFNYDCMFLHGAYKNVIHSLHAFKFETFQRQNQNVHLIQNVPSNLHAFKKNVKIPASQQNVAWMPIAKSIITEHSVFVELDMLEILIISVKNVSYFLILKEIDLL